ncbi:Primosomal replication protein N'' [Legionella massiliensis]|uniref:Primosomal replication protein N n=1 Tax=Legionella massiliensis TaxID=1034943 RepID=A0A078KNK6_9GAMM|nr:primosomal replication protein PriC [Legionella massiliensis]CDZ75910.1 Primosomal replication protein N'' [Legionella massiliensis]CEE11648.1 hypothetical protein BN1094_00170 [Legionella massiliensis]
MNAKILLQELAARLPELEWKISSLGCALPISALPKGLFHTSLDMNAASCIAEIKADIQQLAAQKNQRSAQYLAERIKQKISVLVALCHLQANKPKTEEKKGFGLDKISTRQQWIQALEKDINLLNSQREALEKTLAQLKVRGDAQAVLQLQAELGAVEKRLTLAKETLASA